MSRISDYIEALLKEMMDENNGLVEISQNSLPIRSIACASQITYVLSTRFTNDQRISCGEPTGVSGWIDAG